LTVRFFKIKQLLKTLFEMVLPVIQFYGFTHQVP